VNQLQDGAENADKIYDSRLLRETPNCVKTPFACQLRVDLTGLRSASGRERGWQSAVCHSHYPESRIL